MKHSPAVVAAASLDRLGARGKVEVVAQPGVQRSEVTAGVCFIFLHEARRW